MQARIKIFFDGGCRPNPGQMETAVVVAGQAYIRTALGHGTRIDAEWLALIHALEIARSLGVPDFVLLGDAADVVNQANGATQCRGVEIEHLKRFRGLTGSSEPPRVRHVKRTQNLAGIALAKLHPR